MAAYEFPEDATDEAVCVLLSSAAERTVTVLLNTDNDTALGQCELKHRVSQVKFILSISYLLPELVDSISEVAQI